MIQKVSFLVFGHLELIQNHLKPIGPPSGFWYCETLVFSTNPHSCFISINNLSYFVKDLLAVCCLPVLCSSFEVFFGTERVKFQKQCSLHIQET